MSNLELDPPTTLPIGATCQEAITILKKEGRDQLPVVEADGHCRGVVTLSAITNNIISGKIKSTDIAEKVLVKNFRKLCASATIGRLSRILEKESYVVVVDEKQNSRLVGIAHQMDVLNYITKPQSNGKA